jgi:hypothetical protein
MKFTLAAALSAALMYANPAAAQQFNPQPGWKDSYSVGGKCYCDTNGFDHGIGTQIVATPIGPKPVAQVCADITAKLGAGPTAGRVPYNDIQCGNGPANDQADESGCPGRIDLGPGGCNTIGPTWDLQSVYGAPTTVQLPRAGWTFAASNNAGAAAQAIDGSVTTRWATQQTQRPGQFFQIDLGSVQTFDRIVLNTNYNPQDFPRVYAVSLSDDGSSWRGPVASGPGSTITDIVLAKQNARFIRIDQNGSDGTNWWSIEDLTIYAPVAPGGATCPAR